MVGVAKRHHNLCYKEQSVVQLQKSSLKIQVPLLNLFRAPKKHLDDGCKLICVSSREGVCALCHGCQSFWSSGPGLPDDAPGLVVNGRHHRRASEPRHRS